MWTQGPELPFAFLDGASVQLGRETFLLVGGWNSNKRIMQFNHNNWIVREELLDKEDRNMHVAATVSPLYLGCA